MGFELVCSSVSEYPVTGTHIRDLSAHGDKIPAGKNWAGEEFGSWSKGTQSAMVGTHGCEASMRVGVRHLEQKGLETMIQQ